jgi:hypothetical protein
MTGPELETFCEEINGGASIGTTVLFQFINLAKAMVEQTRPWVALRETDVSKSVAAGNTWQTQTPEPAPTPTPAPIAPPEAKYDWSMPDAARHSVRVICDEEGLTLDQKDTMCATIGAESGWKPGAINYNRNKDGSLASTDYGICQWNDYYHGKEISPDDALHIPEKAVPHVRLLEARPAQALDGLYLGKLQKISMSAA